MDIHVFSRAVHEAIPNLEADILNDKDLLVYPKNIGELSSFIKLCNDKKVGVVTVGGETHVGIHPEKAGVYLLTHDLSKIIELAKDDLTVTVEAGITIKELAEALKKHNFLLPVSHHEKPDSTIGGLLSRDAGGIEQYAYGTIHDYLLGLEFVTPTGELIKTGGKTVKNVTGYDFTRMFAKSWGSLGVITKATFKLIPMPVEKVLFITYATSITELAQQMQDILSKRYALVTFMGMSGGFLGLAEGIEYGGVFVLAGSRQAVVHQLDSLESTMGIKHVLAGSNNVDKYLEGLLSDEHTELGDRNVEGDLIFGTDRKTLLNSLPKELDEIGRRYPMNILLDGGRNLVKLKDVHDHKLVKELRNLKKQVTVSFSDERAHVDILYTRIKRALDPNMIMNPNNPKFVEVR